MINSLKGGHIPRGLKEEPADHVGKIGAIRIKKRVCCLCRSSYSRAWLERRSVLRP